MAGDYAKDDLLRFVDARVLAQHPQKLSDHQLQQCWHSYARQISYLHADDYGDDWKQVPALIPAFKALETEIRARGLPRPTGNYLISSGDRIDWEKVA
jgi:hypothetical protein